jgi:hypothetical protein
MDQNYFLAVKISRANYSFQIFRKYLFVFVRENQGVHLPGGYRKFNRVLAHFWSGCCNFFVQISVTVDFDCRKNIP